VKFAWIAAEKASFTVSQLCRALHVSLSGYYAWTKRPESAHARRDRQVRVLVRESFEASRHRYGSPRVHRDLLEQDVRVSRKRVVRLMQEDRLQARARKRFKCTTMSDHDQPVAANLLARDFTAEAPNQRWVGDVKLKSSVVLRNGKCARRESRASRVCCRWATSSAASTVRKSP
jgi:putative transposase